MAARRRDDQRLDRRDVAANIGEVRAIRRLVVRDGRAAVRRSVAAQHRRNGRKVTRSADGDHVDDRRLLDALPRDDHAFEAGAQNALGDSERPVAGTQPAVEAELAEHGQPLQRLGRHLFARREDADRDRQIEAGAVLAQVGRREVHRDAALRELEARVGDRSAHALARLAHRSIPESDDRERRQSLTYVDLDRDASGFDAVDGEGGDLGEHGAGR